MIRGVSVLIKKFNTKKLQISDTTAESTKGEKIVWESYSSSASKVKLIAINANGAKILVNRVKFD